MHLHLDGSKVIQADRRIVFEQLTSPAFIAKSLPDAEGASIVGPDSVEAKMKMRIAVVSATLNVRMSITEKSAPTKARLTATANGSGSSMTIDSVFELTGDRPTTMSWKADAEISGVMAGIGSSLLRGFATKKVTEIFDGITKSLEEHSQK